jgi:hypothetical protein
MAARIVAWHRRARDFPSRVSSGTVPLREWRGLRFRDPVRPMIWAELSWAMPFALVRFRYPECNPPPAAGVCEDERAVTPGPQ